MLAFGCAPASEAPTARPGEQTREPVVLTPLDAPADTLSPDGRTRVTFATADGRAVYTVHRNDKLIIEPSRLGFRFQEGESLETGLVLTAATPFSADTPWEQPWGERRLMRDRHNGLTVSYRQADNPKRGFDVEVRVFDDGLGLRYHVLAEADGKPRAVTEELTEFRLKEAETAWWIPAAEWNRYEYLYKTTAAHDVHRAHTPITLSLKDGPFVSIHEAALRDYSGMWLKQLRTGVFRTELSPHFDGIKARVESAFKTPWRTVQIAEKAHELLNSSLILNLNEPNALGDVSWIKPGKYIGIWWCMHINQCTWGSGPKHGATTERTKAYMDFAAEHGFDGVLVEGWNTGWDGDWFYNGDVFNFTTPYPDFDLVAVAAYGVAKGVRLIGHHETGASVSNYENQMEASFDLYAANGVTQVKTGYVGDVATFKRVDEKGVVRWEYHDGQFAVDHHLRVLKAAAARKIAINAHEPVKDTGLRRTFPNWISREGARGQEYNAWGTPPNPPEHVALLPFTRMLSGPMDYTPGIVDFEYNEGGLAAQNRPTHTLAKELSLYVVLYSPVHMAADLPENYLRRPEALDFIKRVSTDWEQSIALDGAIGDFVVQARQVRGKDDWFVGALTDENARTVTVPLSFLDPSKNWRAKVWRDGPSTDWRTNPYTMTLETRDVLPGETMSYNLAASGGLAIHFEVVP
jgi:alpha-glucosidase